MDDRILGGGAFGDQVYPMLPRFYSSLAEHERADDLAQECWIRLHKARPVLP